MCEPIFLTMTWHQEVMVSVIGAIGKGCEVGTIPVANLKVVLGFVHDRVDATVTTSMESLTIHPMVCW